MTHPNDNSLNPAAKQIFGSDSNDPPVIPGVDPSWGYPTYYADRQAAGGDVATQEQIMAAYDHARWCAEATVVFGEGSELAEWACSGVIVPTEPPTWWPSWKSQLYYELVPAMGPIDAWIEAELNNVEPETVTVTAKKDDTYLLTAALVFVVGAFLFNDQKRRYTSGRRRRRTLSSHRSYRRKKRR